MPGSPVNSDARSFAVTTMPALPSAGWVWPPKVTVPPSLHRLQLLQAFERGVMDALVAGHGRDLFPEPLVRHRKRQRHEAAQEGRIVLQRVAVLIVAERHEVVLLLRRNLPVARAVFGGVDHRDMSRSGRRGNCPAPSSRHPARRSARADWDASSTGELEVRSQVTTSDAVASPLHRFGGRGRQRARAGRAGLHHGRPGDIGRAHHRHHPGRAIEALVLRHGEAEHGMIERLAAAIACPSRPWRR